MGFFGMGWQEIMIIAIVGLIIFGPDRLPELAGQAGKALRDIRKLTQDMSGEFERETGVSVRDLKKQVDKEIAGVKSELTGATATIQKEVNSAKKTVQGSTSTKTTATIASGRGSSAGGTQKTSSVTSAKSATGVKSATAPEPRPVASKSDPLADVSLLDNVGSAPSAIERATTTASASTIVGANGAGGSAIGVSSDRAEAIVRARSRRLAAGYNQPR